jgi:hypothetical protein
MQKLRIVTSSDDFGWEIAHAAVSRRPPISLDRIVARTHMYTYAATVWDLSIVQGPFSVSPRQTLTRRFATSHRCSPVLLAQVHLGAHPAARHHAGQQPALRGVLLATSDVREAAAGVQGARRGPKRRAVDCRGAEGGSDVGLPAGAASLLRGVQGVTTSLTTVVHVAFERIRGNLKSKWSSIQSPPQRGRRGEEALSWGGGAGGGAGVRY